MYMCVLLNGKSRGVGWVIPTGQNSVNEGVGIFSGRIDGLTEKPRVKQCSFLS